MKARDLKGFISSWRGLRDGGVQWESASPPQGEIEICLKHLCFVK